jgi:hypothetical protein
VVNPRLKAFGDRLGKEMVGNLNREAKKSEGLNKAEKK